MMTNLPHPEVIEEQASLWAARLESGSMSDRDQHELAAWLHANPAHRAALEAYSTLSAKLETHLDAMLGCALETAREHRGARRRRLRIVTSALAAAATLVVASIWYAHRPEHYRTDTAQRRTDILSDGTRMDLNAETEVSVRFSRNGRHVTLSRGEALFTVSRDSARPFVVATKAGDVRVTGTVFNVRTLRADQADVTVLEGTVRVNSTAASNAERSVTGGQRARIAIRDVEIVTLPQDELDDVIAWREGKAVLNNEPLAEVIERFAAYHRRTIEVEPAAGVHRVGGRYTLDDLEGLLESLELLLPIHVIHEPDGRVRIVARGESP